MAFHSPRRDPLPTVSISTDPETTTPQSTTASTNLSNSTEKPNVSRNLSPSPGAGWGKVICNGKTLSVTFGTPSTRNESMTQGSTPKLEELRKLMRDEPEPLDYYIVPSEDAHQSEYVALPDKRREYLSNFSGSVGVAIVSMTDAHVFADSRYWVQASREIDSNWTLHKVGFEGEQDWLSWIRDVSERNKLWGVDSRLISYQTASRLVSALSQRHSKLRFPRVNLVDASRPDRPVRPNNPIFIQELKYTGQATSEKIHIVREWIRSQRPPSNDVLPAIEITDDSSSAKQVGVVAEPKNAAAIPTGTVISSLDCIAWILNLRGSDVPFNPVFFAYLVITLDEIMLFIEPGKLGPAVEEYLKELNVVIKGYGDIWSYLRKGDIKGKMLLAPDIPYAVALMLPSSQYTVLGYSKLVDMKAIKNETEIAGFRSAYLRDGAAFVRWYAWLEEKIRNREPVTEWGAAQKLTEYRTHTDGFMGLAYENISCTGANAALPHYTPSRSDSALIDLISPYLNDSGGQYLDGTCDTTRTVHFGSPTQEQKDAFTRVLQGHIAIDSAVFPVGTTGAKLDVLARNALWQEQLDYGHGTGHGIGSFLNVHEGPHGFSTNVPLKPGYVISNEPGYYKEGEFGIRIESVLLVKELERKSDGKQFLGFERFTQVPIQTSKMVNYSMLTRAERRWLKNHNATCLEKLTPVLEGDRRALRWLKRECGATPTLFGKGRMGLGGVEIIWD